MDPEQHNTETTVATDGVTVRQTYAEKRFDVPTVALELDSGRDKPVNLRLVVELPASLEVEEVGFHPNFRHQNWSVEDRRLVFEVTVPPDRPITTVYAVESLQPAQLDALLENLQVDHVSVASASKSGQSQDAADADRADHDGEGSADADTWTTAPSESTNREHSESALDGHDSRSDEEEHDPGSDAENGTTAMADVATENSEQGSETGPPTAEETADNGVATAALSEYSAMDLVAELVARLSETNSQVDKGRVQSIQQGKTVDLLVEDDSRIADLQRRMSDVEALLKPLEGLPAHDPVETIDELDNRIETLAGDFEGIEKRVDEVDERVDESVADIEPHVDSLAEELGTTRNELHEQIGEVDSRVDAVADEVERIEDTVQSVEEELVTVTEDVETVTEEIEHLAEDLDALANDVATIESDQEALTEEVSQLSEWRENVKNVLKTLGD